jgi:hypothetical protein
MDMNNTYWGNNGKYQQEVEKLNNLMPDFEYTDNPYINLFITISHIYYRIYNDGDSFLNFENRVTRYVEPFRNDIYFNSFKEYKDEELEELINRVIEFIKDKDLNYTQHVIYVNHDNKELSKVEKDGFKRLISGTAKYLEDWINSFLDFGYKIV